MNYRMIKHTLGYILLFEAAFMLVPLLTALVYRERNGLYFLLTMAMLAVAGGLLLFWRKPTQKTLYAKEGFVIVSLSWIFLSLFGCLPFYLSGEIPSFVDALFETVSGFTTTGASILSDVEALSHCMLIWRSFTHWVGGMGILVFIMVFIPLSGGRNMHIMRAESTGPSVNKLVPRVRGTAFILYGIYIGCTLLQFLLIVFDPTVSAFDALNIAFGTAGTGGFSVKNSGFQDYSPYVQTLTAAFMLLFSVSFTSYYLIGKKRLREAVNSEVRLFFLIVLLAIVGITANLYATGAEYATFGETLRHVFFQVSSVISTTGFATADFALWPYFSGAVLVLLMFIGACAGSTGGGIKVSRLMIFFRSMRTEMSLMLHPKQIKKTTLDGRVVDSLVIRTVYAYMAAYIALFLSVMLLLSLEGHDLVTNFTATVAMVNNIGPGLSQVGPMANFGFFSDFSKCVMSFAMLAGRLELFPVLLLFSPATWKK
ncbi:MAG: TrkH family potassium uptake protein [Clostridia bacterium]|nr:TrkH family potassium uptake protein [Clostridia bacterium]